MPLLADFFIGLGWPWVGELIGFIIIFVCFPTQQNLVNRIHPIGQIVCWRRSTKMKPSTLEIETAIPLYQETSSKKSRQ